MKLIPNGNYILGKLDTESSKTTKGGLILADNAKRSNQFLDVIAVGPGSYTITGEIIPVPYKPGDRLVINRLAPQIVPKELGDDLVYVSVGDVIGKIEED